MTYRHEQRWTTRRDGILHRIGTDNGSTPCYVYFWSSIREQIRAIRAVFADRFQISYAVKANPNPDLIRGIAPQVELLDVSSGGELQLAIACGWKAECLSFSGPAKRPEELLTSVRLGCGYFVCESVDELKMLNEIAEQQSRDVRVLLRVNPLSSPEKFSLSMSQRGSQFGIDEENVDDAIRRFVDWKRLKLEGFHVYSATNSLDVDALNENLSGFADLFERYSSRHELKPRQLIFGAGFGIPYRPGQQPLDLAALAKKLNPRIDSLRRQSRFQETNLVLETGRYLVGLAGYFLTRVIRTKSSRGVEIAICDGGMNNHLAACNLMGSIVRRNWPIWNVSAASDQAVTRTYRIVGPLCTTIDTLANDLELPSIQAGDVIAVGSSGAYGLTASPTRFISHPEPCEYFVE